MLIGAITALGLLTFFIVPRLTGVRIAYSRQMPHSTAWKPCGNVCDVELCCFPCLCRSAIAIMNHVVCRSRVGVWPPRATLNFVVRCVADAARRKLRQSWTSLNLSLKCLICCTKRKKIRRSPRRLSLQATGTNAAGGPQGIWAKMNRKRSVLAAARCKVGFLF